MRTHLEADSLEAESPSHVTFDACWEDNLPLWIDKHLWKHYLSRKLRLKAVMMTEKPWVGYQGACHAQGMRFPDKDPDAQGVF